MKIAVDLTRISFEDADVTFYDSKTIFFDPTTVLPKTVSFKVWGAGLMPEFNWSEYLSMEEYPNLKLIRQQTPSNETAIRGFGTLTFNEVVAGKILIWPLDCNQFLKDHKGNQVEYKREWNLNNIDSSCFEYWLDSNIYFPYGGCDLKLYAKGRVTFEFDTDHCVNYLDFITNPNRQETFWGYLKDETLTTNSYKYEQLDCKQKAFYGNRN
jgi:hypothetical protein